MKDILGLSNCLDFRYNLLNRPNHLQLTSILRYSRIKTLIMEKIIKKSLEMPNEEEDVRTSSWHCLRVSTKIHSSLLIRD